MQNPEYRIIYVFLILTLLTRKELHIHVAANNALTGGDYNWPHLMEIGARRLGRELGQTIAPVRENFQLLPTGQYVSASRTKKPTKKKPPPSEPPQKRRPRKRSANVQESLTLSLGL